MIKHIPFDHTKSSPLIPALSANPPLLSEKSTSIIVILCDKDIEESTNLVSRYLSNAQFVKAVKKSAQTIYGTKEDLFEVGFVSYVKNA